MIDPTRPPPPIRGTQAAPEQTFELGDGKRLELLVSAADGVRLVPLLKGTSPVIGRTTDADIVVSDPSISRRHARLHIGSKIEIEDLGSMNGTAVAGARIPVGTRLPLELGVAFHIASATFVLQCVRDRRSSSSPSTRKISVLDLVDAPSPDESSAPDGIIVVSPAMHRLYAVIDVVAPTSLSVLILGETGVGKEGIAENIHVRSKRAGRKFLKLNCAALPESLLEAELFGYERGSFTGATTSKPGLFEAADGGTVFLDEIGEIGLSTQAKLLRVLECGEVLRMGSVVPKKIDVRYVAATNRDLKGLISAGQFRADLFFRLNGVSLNVPPLAERKEEILPIAMHFARLASMRLGRETPAFDPSANAALESYPWPGNVRELRNVIDRAVALCGTQAITAAHFLLDVPTPTSLSDDEADNTGQFRAMNPERRGTSMDSARRIPVFDDEHEDTFAVPMTEPRIPIAKELTPGGGVDFKAEMRALEKQRIVEALERHGGNQSRAAKELNISRHTLMQRMETYGLARPRKKNLS
jgi:two-component system response regulator AtoC